MGDEEKLIATNRQASRRYELRDTYEAGLVLVGSEVKSLREAKGVQLTESYADVSQSGEMWLRSLHIAAYTHAQDHSGHEPTRPRKMLLHRLELDRIAAKVAQERFVDRAAPAVLQGQPGEGGVCARQAQEDGRPAARHR